MRLLRAFAMVVIVCWFADSPVPAAAEGSFAGGAPGPGFALALFSGGSVEELAVAAPHATSFFAAAGGQLVGYIVGAPDFVNQAFLDLFAGGIPANTPFVILSTSPAAVTPPPPVAPSTEVGPVPVGLGLDPFYKKYLDAEGIPIVSSDLVPDEALYAAKAIVVGMLEGAPQVRTALIANGVRVAIMAVSEVTTDIPEHSDLYEAFPGTDWDTRARGLGATLARPATSAAEENLLCYPADGYVGESILVHEFAHTLFDLGVASLLDGAEYSNRLDQAYADAVAAGRWANTYAATNRSEYWAESVQSWFNTNIEAIPANGIHNSINTRAELSQYDPEIAQLISDVLPTTWVPSCP